MSCQRDSRATSCPRRSPYFFHRQTHHPDHFIPAGLAGCNSNGGTRYLQKFCEKIDAGFVGFAVDGRSGQGQFQRVANFAGDGILLRSRMDFDCEGGSVGRILNCYHRKVLPLGTQEETQEQSSILRSLALFCIPPCSSVPPVVMILLFPRKSPSPRAHMSLPLQSRLRNRATCPSKELPCRLAAAHARRCYRESDGVGGNRGASPPDLLCMAGRSSVRESVRFFHCGAPRRICSSSSEPGATPLLACSPPTLISIRTGNVLPALSANAFSFSASAHRVHGIDRVK